ncbi:reverse transcriptase family protein [Mammaliicoccus sciuri]|uniref:reverse transcriptase family protein n=1 Tax=Mammaliicoccus sciuri TaxID=1296 RepID=UPI002899B3EB|nr:reverse transcriptase family protein [Mammaliicoccus sciuri]MEB5759847.1 reverse transcriptase family protein [Mammaliicoccus sciuri]
MRKQAPKFYNINQSALYKCRSKKRLAKLLKTDLKTIQKIAKGIEFYYNSFSMGKKDSKKIRKVDAPDNQLKRIQKNILNLLKKIEKPDYVVSGTLGKSYIDNAQYHIKGNYFLKTDIKQFYNNCSRDRVYRFYIDKMKTSPDVAAILTDLTTYNNIIPTGSPPSQIIAYFAYEDMFRNMYIKAKENGFLMSLYVDDLTFSRFDYIDYKPFLRIIEIEAIKFKHSLKKSKTMYYSPNRAALITGVIIKNKKMKIPNRLRNNTISQFIYIKDERNRDEKAKLSLRGSINSARMIEPYHFNGVFSFYKQLKNS